MRVTELWQAKQRPTISFELFPPRTEKAAANLPKVLGELARVGPDFVSVTFGAGGSTREGSRELIETLQREHGLEVMAYFACYGLGPYEMAGVLDAYRALGVSNLLAVRGDPPGPESGFTPHPGSLAHASDLISYVRARWDFCVGAAGYPEGHAEAESQERDLFYLKLKVERGAEFILTNYFYDNRYFVQFVERCRAAGIKVPIVPGVMPIYSVKLMHNLARLCGATIPSELSQQLAALPEGDQQALQEFAIRFAANQCRELLEAGVPGLHVYTMDRSKVPVQLVEHLRADGLV